MAPRPSFSFSRIRRFLVLVVSCSPLAATMFNHCWSQVSHEICSALGPAKIMLHFFHSLARIFVIDLNSTKRLKTERESSLDGGNTRRRWHGTIRVCNLGSDGQHSELCPATECSLCHIVRSSFQLTKAGERFNFGRFGEGIYTSATSSKANDYVKNVTPCDTKRYDVWSFCLLMCVSASSWVSLRRWRTRG
ncbi:hypothetical protein BXZ70DRAFT_505611 [Cristinia sonorae]|uniref:PARP catalytic domain-containing protein n=1 Tax=Cristinia sonorae TaxID=1940300 RepID=A0A8K0XT95_9AGAR|nr:hypothetical protein BXZ70DRAFT_505611 [Cristinia sonorae]